MPTTLKRAKLLNRVKQFLIFKIINWKLFLNLKIKINNRELPSFFTDNKEKELFLRKKFVILNYMFLGFEIILIFIVAVLTFIYALSNVLPGDFLASIIEYLPF